MATVRLAQLIAPAHLPSSAAALFTAQTGETAAIHAASLTNTTAGSQTVTVHIVPSGGSVADSNMVLKARSVAANTSVTVPELINHIIPAGAAIHGFCSAGTAISLAISGMIRTA